MVSLNVTKGYPGSKVMIKKKKKKKKAEHEIFLLKNVKTINL